VRINEYIYNKVSDTGTGGPLVFISNAMYINDKGQ